MTFREHRKEDMLLKMAMVADKNPCGMSAGAPRQDLIFAGNTDYLAGFQPRCGYTPLGSNPIEKVHFLYQSRNGKSKTIVVLTQRRRVMTPKEQNMKVDEPALPNGAGIRPQVCTLHPQE